MPVLTLPSPVGTLTLTEEDGHLTQLGSYASTESDETPLLREAKNQLAATLTPFPSQSGFLDKPSG